VRAARDHAEHAGLRERRGVVATPVARAPKGFFVLGGVSKVEHRAVDGDELPVLVIESFRDLLIERSDYGSKELFQWFRPQTSTRKANRRVCRQLPRRRPLLGPAKSPDQQSHHSPVGLTGPQAHRQTEIDNDTRRKQSIPLLLATGLRNDPVDLVRRECLCQNADRDEIGESRALLHWGSHGPDRASRNR
jgi:hypothetical protein